MIDSLPSPPETESVLPKQNVRMRYVLSTLNYLFQAVFATFTAKFITMYLYAYLTLTPWEVFWISLLSYLPLLLKPVLAFLITRRNMQKASSPSPFHYKPWLMGASIGLFVVLIAVSFITSPSQLPLFIGILFLAQLGFAGLDVLNDNLILELGPQVNIGFSLLQRFAAVVGSILSLILYNLFVPAEVAAGNWQGLFLALAGGMILMCGVNGLYSDVTLPTSSKPLILKGSITKNHWILIGLLFFLNAAYIVDFQSELIVSARFGEEVLRHLFLGQTIGTTLGYAIVILLAAIEYFKPGRIKDHQKEIFVLAGIYSLVYLVLTPFVPSSVLFVLSIGYGPFSTLLMVAVVSLMASFVPTGHRGLWYQINAWVYAVSRFLFTNLGNSLYAGLHLDPTDPLLFYIAGGLLFLNIPFLFKLQILSLLVLTTNLVIFSIIKIFSLFILLIAAIIQLIIPSGSENISFWIFVVVAALGTIGILYCNLSTRYITSDRSIEY